MTVSDEGSDFEFNENDSGSDFVDSGDESDFAPEPPAKKTKTNGATGKARKDPESKQAKAPATPRTRKTPSKKGNAGQSNTLDAFLKDTSKSTSANGKKDSDDEMDDSDAKPEPQKPKETKSASRSGGDYEQRTIEEIYKKKTQLEHILLRPDTYIGSTEAEEQELWVFDSEEEIIKKKKIRYVPGLYKIVDEILVNAADNKIRDPSMNTIKVIIDRAQNFISIYNNGRGIPVTIHKDEGVYVPELIFGHLLTSSNYDDNEKKVTGGRNGYGAKLCNIFSTEFIVETADKERELKYRQVFKNNMSSKSDPKVTSNSKGEEFTRISFKPDLAKFNMTELDEDFEALIKKRVYDLAGCVEGVNVYLNGTKIPIKGFQKYVDMYTKSMSIRNAEGKKPIIHDIQGKTERWQVSFAVSDGQFQQVSFVNSICTAKGGTHVNHVTDQIVKAVISQVQKQSKNQNIRPFQIKNHMCVFINCLIENPAFDSQTKENMTLRQSAFGSSYKMSEAFSKAVAKSGIIDSIVNWIKVKEDQQMTKADSGKISRRLNIPKLDDANLAGRKPHNKKCTLILTEGDSAKNLVLSGLSVVGRDYYGVFPLRGKMLNVRDAPNTQIMNNQEITNIKQILGLKHGQTYNSVDDLRYGKLMIMTDQDQDGSHIKGLIINFIDHMFPSLLDIPGFLLEFITPIIRCTHKRTKAEKAFFTIPEYVQWASQHNDHHKEWTVKYFKGLGTSDKKDARKYFGDLATHMKEFQTADSRDRELINMAFNKKKVAARKEWLLDYSAETFIDHSVDKIKIEDFVNRELMLFSMGDNIRSIPSMVDGLKPGQRKVLYGSIKRPRNTEIKVAQLANYVAGVTQYHHGEASVAATIIGMAQDFVGSNNINLLEPAGQFGSRHEGGKAAASPRYLFTRLTSIARVLFHPDDDNILDYQIEEGKVIEPKWYMPVLPMVLVNGADGIGTGYSTNIPNYNPKDIIDNLLRMMDGQDPVPMKPWFRGFKGEIIPSAPGRYTVNGIAEVTDEQDVKVTELPVRLWTESFTEHLNTLREPKDKKPEFTITDYRNNSTDSEVEFTIHLEESSLNKAQDMGLLKAFKITSTIATTNLVCFDKDGKLKKYETPEDILRDFYPLRLEYYEKRKAHLVSVLKYEYSRLDNRARFVDLVVSGQLKYVNRPKKEIIKDLEEFKLEKIYPMKKKSVLITEDDEGEENNNSKPQESNAEEGTGYEYLFSMSVISFSREMIEDLNKQKTNKLHELNTIETTTAKDFWKRDLEAVLKKWEEILKADEEFAKHAKPLQPSKATKRKRTVKKPKKEKVVENMDVDED